MQDNLSSNLARQDEGWQTTGIPDRSLGGVPSEERAAISSVLPGTTACNRNERQISSRAFTYAVKLSAGGTVAKCSTKRGPTPCSSISHPTTSISSASESALTMA